MREDDPNHIFSSAEKPPLKQGHYRLTRDVENPCRDRRKDPDRDWLFAAKWDIDSRWYVDEEGRLHKRGRWRYDCVRPTDTLYVLIAAHLEPVPEDLRGLRFRLNMDHELWDTVERLITDGKLTLADIEQAHRRVYSEE